MCNSYLAAFTGMNAVVESTSFVTANAAQHRSAVKLCNKTKKTFRETCIMYM